MIDYLRHMAIFSAVVDQGSFSAAARSLGIAPSRVSEAVSRLEHYLDATLLNRTTRKVMLTSEGREFYAYTAAMVGEAREGLTLVRTGKRNPSGTLRVSMPSYLSRSNLLAATAAFGQAYPDVHVTISFNDNDVDPITDGFDVCVRAGAQEYTGPVARRRLGQLERVIVVGRDYCARQASPAHPKDLETWNWITYRHRHRRYRLTAQGGKRTEVVIEQTPKLQLDNLDAVHFLVGMNVGVSVMPLEICRESLAEGSIIRLFENWRLSKVHQFVVWAETTKRASLASVFADFLAEEAGSSRAEGRAPG
ncbi:MAG: LysR family transcriptional regulator [Pseudomonadota bacterium]